MVSCPKPGCPGTLIDGICDECGHEVGPASAVLSAAVASSLPTGGAMVVSCPKPGCPGTIVDGICDTCGHQAGAVGPETVGTVGGPSEPPMVTAPVSSAISEATAAFRLSSTELGSTPTTGRIRASRGNLGAGLVTIPPVPHRDPLAAVLENPSVPERKRFCTNCHNQVGHTREGRPGIAKGCCPYCGTSFSFIPKLAPGELVAGRYYVVGCIAHGGLGWVYLAQDRNLENSPTVLKGLIDSNDQEAMANAMVERHFLVEVDHPNIVNIRDFVEHDESSYIVMDYVGGESLREARNRYRDEHDGESLPVATAIAYVLEILPAFEYLHSANMLYCDFKPDNVIHSGDTLKLIDLGGVRMIDDDDSAIYGTRGYQAPEVIEVGTTIQSDLYTVARTLAVLAFDFHGFSDPNRYATTLPSPGDVPAFQRYPAFYRFMVRATATDRISRFQSAAEMADQLMGVLRQVVAIDGGSPDPQPSSLFTHELGGSVEEPSWRDLPVPAVDQDDPGAGLLATLAVSDPSQVEAILSSAPPSPEIALHLARLWIGEGDFQKAEQLLATAEARQSGWRRVWWRGVLLLASDHPKDARALFHSIDAEWPGELAPQLAQAMCVETSGHKELDAESAATWFASAADHYSIVAATNRTYTSAWFGLARVGTQLGDRATAMEALDRVPSNSSGHLAAQLALCRLACADVAGNPPAIDDLMAGAGILETVRVEPSVRFALALELQHQALSSLVEGRVTPDQSVTLAGVPLSEDGVRSALETTYRSLARLASSDRQRFALVDLANSSRPRSLT